ncbi:IQ domain-containing protein G [Trichogramma pretiosum]|uniref:IQ domain-containing protein G n=1 Tax=Trichogramma pretiosum TaxID=7493 RepID=UPI000C718AF5|nr:IQ domain-containing protein G [Trichogramma pretiosum]
MDEEAAFDAAYVEMIFDKLVRDSQWVEELMHSSRDSLMIKGSLDLLISQVDEKVAEKSNEDDLLERAREGQKLLDLKLQEVEEARKSRAEHEAGLKAQFFKLKNEKERLEIKSKAETEYVEAWLDSSREQRQLGAEWALADLRSQLEECRLRESNERLVNRQIVDFLKDSIEENERDSENWVERRRTETKVYERDIRKLQDEIEQKRAALAQLQLEYQQRQEFIDLCEAENEAERRRLQHEAHRQRCALRIQAWWRGCMVRHKLGPYRPEDRRGRKRQPKAKK